MGVCLGGEVLCDLLAGLGSGGQRCRVVSSMRSGDRRLCFTLVFFLLRCPAPSVWLSCGRRLTHFSVGPVVESKPGVWPLRSLPCTQPLPASLELTQASPSFGRSPLLLGDLTVPRGCCATPAGFPDLAVSRCHLICPRLPRGKQRRDLTRAGPDVASLRGVVSLCVPRL